MPAASRPAPRAGGAKRRPAAKAALIQCWAMLNFPTGKRLQPFLPHLVAPLERHGEIALEPEARRQLLTKRPING